MMVTGRLPVSRSPFLSPCCLGCTCDSRSNYFGLNNETHGTAWYLSCSDQFVRVSLCQLRQLCAIVQTHGSRDLCLSSCRVLWKLLKPLPRAGFVLSRPLGVYRKKASFMQDQTFCARVCAPGRSQPPSNLTLGLSAPPAPHCFLGKLLLPLNYMHSELRFRLHFLELYLPPH